MNIINEQSCINIAVSINSKYVIPAIVMFTSLFENNKFESINIYVLYSSLSLKDKYKISKCIKRYNQYIFFRKINDNIFKGYPLGYHFTKEIYYRLLLHNILPKNLDRVLYLDVDIVINGSIKKFYWQNFGYQTKWGNKENFFIVCKSCAVNKEMCKRLNIPLHMKYFCSGVMIYNLQKLREEVKLEYIFKHIENIKNKLIYPDQDILNSLFYNKVKFENYKVYGVLVSRLNKEDLYYKKAKIFHYIGSYKPWNFKYVGMLGDLWWKYALKSTMGGGIYKLLYYKYKVFNLIYRVYYKLFKVNIIHIVNILNGFVKKI